MPSPLLNIGSAPNDGTGDSLRTLGQKINRLPNSDSTINAGSGDYLGTNEAKVSSAIADAVAQGKKYVFVPQSLLPFNAGLVTFNNAIRLVRDGADPTVYDVKAYGAAGDALDDGSGTNDSPAIQAAINAAQASHNGPVIIPAASYKLLTALTITDPLLVIQGHGRSASVLKPQADSALVINVTSTGTLGPTVQALGFYVTAAVSGKFVVDCQIGSVTLRDIFVGGVTGMLSTWSGAIRIQEGNWSMVDNILVAGSGTDRWPIGLDICPNATLNRGNVTVLGSLLYRCTIGARIAFNNGGQVINNIQFLGTKIQYTGDGLSVGGTGIQVFSSRMLTFQGVHFESFDVPLDMTSVLCATVQACRFVGTPVGGPFSIAVNLKTACAEVTIKNNEFDTGAGAPTGTAVQTDATAHAEIEVSANRYVNVSTPWNDNGTSAGRVLWCKDAISGFAAGAFFFKDKVRALRFVSFPSNVTLGAGNNNNVAQAGGGTWRVTNDAGGSTLTGIAGGIVGDRIRLINVAGGTLTLTHNDTANSTATNCFFTRTGASIAVLANGMVDIEYDSSTTRWRVGPVS